MALQIVCVQRAGKDPRHRHVRAVGVSTSQVVIRFSVKTVRKTIKRGTVDFCVVGPDGTVVSVRRYRCACGAKTIRTTDDDLNDGLLSVLPSCPHPGSLKGSDLLAALEAEPRAPSAAGVGSPRPHGPVRPEARSGL